MINPYLAMLIIGLMLAGLMLGLRTLQHRFNLHPEVARKLMHVIMGLVTLNLPWLFHSNWPVISLAVLAATALFILKRSRLKHHLGQVLHAVDRKSQGDVVFPLAVGMVFVLSKGNAILYCLPILILTIADATAALIGLRYGLSRYQAAEGQKSVEGSLAFFAVSFFSVLVSLIWFTQLGRRECVLIALLLGLLVMMLEAISWQGLDNIFIPLAGFLLLESYLYMPMNQLSVNLLILLALLLLVILARKASGFDSTAVMASALVGYVIWTSGGWVWMIAPLILFLSYNFVLPKPSNETSEVHPAPVTYSVYAVLSATLSGLVWLFLAQTLEQSQLLFPYILSFANYLCIIGLSRLEMSKVLNKKRVVWGSIVYAWGLIPLVFYALQLNNFETLLKLLLAFLSVASSAWIFYFVQPHIQFSPYDLQRWRWQGAIAGVASGLGLLGLVI